MTFNFSTLCVFKKRLHANSCFKQPFKWLSIHCI